MDNYERIISIYFIINIHNIFWMTNCRIIYFHTRCFFSIFVLFVAITTSHNNEAAHSPKSRVRQSSIFRYPPLVRYGLCHKYRTTCLLCVLKVIASGYPFQPPLHPLFCIWRSNPIRFLSKKWPKAESISDKCRVTAHRRTMTLRTGEW